MGVSGSQGALACRPCVERARNSSGLGVVPGVDCTLGQLGMDAKVSCKIGKGGECLWGRCWGTLQERVIGTVQETVQDHFCQSRYFPQRLLQCEGK
jgi:hypothetical protein